MRAHKEIRQHRMNYLSLSEDMTLTQFHMELVKGRALFDLMVGTLYKSMLSDDLNVGYEWLNELLAERKGTPEREAHHTFNRHGIFERFYDETCERIRNRN